MHANSGSERSSFPLLLAALAPAALLASSFVRPVDDDPAFDSIRARDVQMHVDFLASDELEGRSATSPQARIAARYIASCFAAYGLAPMGDAGTWFQAIDDAAYAPNVVGYLAGESEECIVITAHYDHLPPRGQGEDSIFNGADDNASGTAAILELAQAFGEREAKPKRSLLFVAFTGEERGLRGSRFFVEHSPVPLETLIGNVNLDMVSRGQEHVIFCETSEKAEHLLAAANAHAPSVGLTIRHGEHPDWLAQSDHASFMRKDVPALYFGVEDHEDYHKVSDHADKILPELTARVARLVYRMAESL